MTSTSLPGFASSAALSKTDEPPNYSTLAPRAHGLLSEESPTSEERPIKAELRLSSGRAIQIETEGPAPDWLLPVLHELKSVSLLKNNWDGYSGNRISETAIYETLHFLARFLPTAQPSIVPSPRGGLQIEWHKGGADVEVYASPDGSVSVFYEICSTGESWEGEFPNAAQTSRLRQILHKM